MAARFLLSNGVATTVISFVLMLTILLFKIPFPTFNCKSFVDNTGTLSITKLYFRTYIH